MDFGLVLFAPPLDFDQKQVVVAVDQTAVLGSHLAVAVGQMVGFGQVVVTDQTVDLGNHLAVAVGQMVDFELVVVVVDQMTGFGQVAVVVDQIADLGNHLVAVVGQTVDFELVVVIDQTVVLGNRLVVVAFHSSNLDCKAVGQTADLGSFADQIADRMNSQPFQA